MSTKNIFDSLSDKKIIGLLSIIVFILLFFCSHMSPLYFSNEWADPNVYFTIGRSMFNGKTLYTDVFDHKGPFIFILYGLGSLISGTSFFGMFLIEFVGWVAMTTSMYLISKFYLDKAGAFLVATALPVLLIKVMKAGGSAEEFILVLECVSFYFFIKYFKDKDASKHSPSVMLVHGIFCSIVLFTKLNLLIIWFFPLAGIYINLLYKQEFKNFFTNLSAYFIGVLIVAVPICTYLYVNDALQEGYNVYIELNSKYAKLAGLGETVRILLYHTFYLYLEPLALALLFFVGVFYFSIKCVANILGRWSICLSGVFLYILIYMSPVYHYYYPIPLLLFSTLGVLGVAIYVKKFVGIDAIPTKVILVLSVVIIYAGLSQKSLIETRTASLLVTNPGIMMQKSQKIIMAEKNPTLLNLNFSLANGLFNTCNIIPNVRYFVSPNLTKVVYPQMRAEQERYIRDKEVQFVIATVPVKRAHTSLIMRKKDEENDDFYDNLTILRENYNLVALDTIINTIDERSYDIYALYKRKD
ncbi:MAG: hypothetical protein RL662_1937 [Bacteroidota bacterium]|jgi:hypothetical protein